MIWTEKYVGLRINVMACVMWALFRTLNQSNNDGSNKSKLIMQWCTDLLWIDPASIMPSKLGNPPFMLAETRWSNCSTLLCLLSTLEQLNILATQYFAKYFWVFVTNQWLSSLHFIIEVYVQFKSFCVYCESQISFYFSVDLWFLLTKFLSKISS